MAMAFARSWNGAERAAGRRAALLIGGLLAANLGAWALAILCFHDRPLLLGTAMLAWSFGLRHAVDADHIAAIDNVTRKLMQQGRRPVATGFWFSLGHSTVVVIASVVLAATATAFKDQIEEFHSVGGIIGTCVSAGFLLLIAACNLVVLRRIYLSFRRVAAGETLHEDSLEEHLRGGGPLTAILRPAFRLVTRSWHMYPLGLLFGLGFDTATEIAVLGISATQAAQGMDVWMIMIFPLLFTAGMSLIDTIDSVLMLFAYGWAFLKPVRKLYYNMTITAISALVALLIGGIEALGLVADKLELAGPVWGVIGTFNDSLGNIGFLIIGVFVLAWIVSVANYRLRGYHRLDARIAAE